MEKHIWKGHWIGQEELEQRLNNIQNEIEESLTSTLDSQLVIEACHKFSTTKQDEIKFLLKSLAINNSEVNQLYDEIISFCNDKYLKQKVLKEVGRTDFLDFIRINYNQDIFEAYSPLGVLAHVTAGNSFTLSFFSVIEGLLTGNMNILKMSSKETNLTQILLKMLCESDSSGLLKKYICALKIGSNDHVRLKKIFKYCDGIVAWGGDSAIESIKEAAPVQTRIIPWGHKISFAYVAREKFEDLALLERLALDCVKLEQQACSSPQCIFLETDKRSELVSFANKFSNILGKVSKSIAQEELSTEEMAEISNVTQMCKLDTIMSDSYVIEDRDKVWRILVENSSLLKPSPLFRTIWIRPLLSKNIIKTLIPWRNYLQTTSLLADDSRSPVLAKLLIKAGATRVTPSGEMLDTYEGEPHDGEYALRRYLKATRIEIKRFEGVSRLSDFNEIQIPGDIASEPVMSKQDFQKQNPQKDLAKLYFRSGGSSGDPTMSVFSYRDYQQQMKFAAEGLYAAGLEPEKDRVINLFFGGGLYGGFLSFFTILEYLDAKQWPMGAYPDYKMVGDAIVKQNINVLLGMPSYILQLIKHNFELFKSYGNIKKILYGGEHFSEKARQWIHKELNVKLIKSASYGSVDAGPLGYQCTFCQGSIHHLHHKLHHLEILKSDSDHPVKMGEIGRMVFTSQMREAMKIKRYDLGDMGRFVEGHCPCGRKSPRFEILGRTGDIFRAGGTFFNYQKISKILKDEIDYSGEMQIIINKQEELQDKLILCLDNSSLRKEKSIKEMILEKYKDLREAVIEEQCLLFELKLLTSDDFIRTNNSGKLVRVLDRR